MGDNRYRLINEYVSTIKDAEIQYRSGTPTITDKSFDDLVDKLRELDPGNPTLVKIIGEVVKGKKHKLSVRMGSMDKIKSYEFLEKWIKTKDLGETEMIIMPKFDGISVLGDCGKFFTRGDDGIEGVEITSRYMATKNNYQFQPNDIFRGELIIKNSETKILKEYASLRSAVVGLMKGDSPIPSLLKSIEIVPFDLFSSNNTLKSEDLDFMKKSSTSNVMEYELLKGRNIKSDHLEELFNRWNTVSPIDGIIIEVNNKKTKEELSYRESNGNPLGAIAFKNDYGEKQNSVVTAIIRQVTKNGRMIPIAIIDPVTLHGDVVTRANLDNDRYAKKIGIGVGSKVVVKKSGSIVPRISHIEGVDVEDIKSGKEINSFCKYVTPEQFNNGSWVYDKENIFFNQKVATEGMLKKQLLHSFKILKIKHIGDAKVEELFKIGINSLDKVLEADINKIRTIDSWKNKTITRYFDELEEKLSKANLAQFMHSTGMFEGIGEHALSKIINKKVDEEIIDVVGVGEHASQIYKENIGRFNEVYLEHIARINNFVKGGSLEGKVYCFTNFRDEKIVAWIEENGGEYKSSMSSKVTHLVTPNDSMSKKVESAKNKGIEIVNRFSLEYYKDTKIETKTIDVSNSANMLF